MTALLLGLVSLAFSQSKETGSIQGIVLDQEKVPLPGVTVTLSSPNLMGTRTAVTDASGLYRFPALPPGTYQVKAQLQGFKTHIQENIRIQTTMRLSIDIIMTQSSVEEEVTVVAQAPTVDTKSTETASITLSSEILRNIPYNQFSSNIVNMAPGVTLDEWGDSYGGSAYGAQDGTGIAYSLDGVNVADPEGGTAWVFLDHNIIEEAKVMGVGLPAEYGNFTGVIFNIVTKSGGNQFSGHFEMDFQGQKEDWPHGFWQQDNIDAYLADYPDLTAPAYKFYDASIHVGGPIKKDKVWFYQGLQFQHFADYITGFLGGPRAYDQPHSFTKITAQLSPSTNMIFGFEIDSYNGENRGADITTAPDAVVGQKSPEVVGNFSLTHIFSPKTFLDVKAAYFWGYYYLEPKMGRQTYSHLFQNDNPDFTGQPNGNATQYNASYYYLADRTRFQANASLTHYAENFITGNHDFKFGVEVEHSTCRTRYGYTGSGGPLGNYVYYTDYWAYGYTGNYLAYQYEGYDFNAPYTRVEAFVQDAWQITSRLNINAGVRFSQNWGQVEGKGTVYNTNRIAPRIGLTFDLFGDKKTILKAHYGQFTEAMLAAYFNRLSPKWSDKIGYIWDIAASEWVEFERIKQDWKIQDNIKHPYLNQFTVSLERELFKDASVSVSYIHRDWKNIIGVYDLLAVYEPVDYDVPPLGKKYTVYNLVSGNAHEFMIENIQPGPDRPYYGERAYRKYQGLEFLFNKRFSNKWQLMLSYVYSITKGTIDNTWAADIGWQNYEGQQKIFPGDPNYWINADGHPTFDPTHMIKIQGTYVLPYDIYFNAYFRGITGMAWAQRFRTGTGESLDLYQGRETFFTEPRGSNHYSMETSLDLRLEKTFILSGKYRLGIMIDCFNLFNTNTIREWGTRIGYDWTPGDYPSTDGHELIEIVDPRQIRLGIRFTF
jgi:hypothetical protein